MAISIKAKAKALIPKAKAKADCLQEHDKPRQCNIAF